MEEADVILSFRWLARITEVNIWMEIENDIAVDLLINKKRKVRRYDGFKHLQ